jgi:predicted flap endonuclease-1-like 5' DNA nuclease/predicted  nucleic acid-binding Zn-ribbon protein
MPEITAIHFALFTLLFTIGAVLGWIMRGDRSARERIAVNAGWQERVEAQEREQKRLVEQNTDLMQAVSQYKAAQKDTAQRGKELSQALKSAVARRDELQRQIKDIRGDLEGVIRQRDQLQTDIKGRESRGETTVHALREKDNKIFKLSRELTSWQNRLPPLIIKFRDRDEEAKSLARKLREAEQRIANLESQQPVEGARIEPARAGGITEGLDACNDQFDESAEIDLSDLQDQIGDEDELASPVPVGTFDDTASYASYAEPPTQRDPTGDRTGMPVNGVPALQVIRDDLQQIKGVGPAIERTLHDLGIFSFDQIARISEYDINRIAERLKGFRSRIYREDWIGQARTLHDLRQGDPA